MAIGLSVLISVVSVAETNAQVLNEILRRMDVNNKALQSLTASLTMVKTNTQLNVSDTTTGTTSYLPKSKLTGGKMQKKLYRYHTLFPGGLRDTPAEKLLQKHPEQLIQSAVKGMLPKNRLGRKLIKKLKVYAGAEHKHAAQEPKPLALR